MASRDEQLGARRRLSEDEVSYYKAAAKLKAEELKARQEKALIRQYRQRQLRIWLAKAKTFCAPVVIKLKQMLSRRHLMAGAATLVAIGLVWWAFRVLPHQTKDQAKTFGAHITQPDFKPAIPQNSSPKVTTAENNHQTIATYQDTFAGFSLTVTQQKLPDNFRSDPQAITKLDQFKSAVPLDTPKGKLYITTNTTGQQWAVMTYSELLIFFQTNKTIDTTNWYKYISSLQVK